MRRGKIRWTQAKSAKPLWYHHHAHHINIDDLFEAPIFSWDFFRVLFDVLTVTGVHYLMLFLPIIPESAPLSSTSFLSKQVFLESPPHSRISTSFLSKQVFLESPPHSRISTSFLNIMLTVM